MNHYRSELWIMTLTQRMMLLEKVWKFTFKLLNLCDQYRHQQFFNLLSNTTSFFPVYINLNPLLISHGTSHQSTSASGAIIGIQNETDFSSVGAGDASNAGDSGLIMGAPIGSCNSGNTAAGDDSAIITPMWLKTSR